MCYSWESFGLLRAIPVAATVIVPKFHGAELGNFAAFAKLIKPSVLPGSARRRGNIHEKKEDSVDPSVGIVVRRKLGDQVSAREPLCTIHHNSEARAAQAARLFLESYQIASTPATLKKPPLIQQVIRGTAAK